MLLGSAKMHAFEFETHVALNVLLRHTVGKTPGVEAHL
jgi:hypothetical protein